MYVFLIVNPARTKVKHGYEDNPCSLSDWMDIYFKKRKLKQKAIGNLRLGKWADAGFIDCSG